MWEQLIFYLHGGGLLVFGVLLSAAFSGVRCRGRNAILLFCLSLFCGSLQLAVNLLFDEALVWKLYPLITHLPVILFLCVAYRKPVITALAAVLTAYLCCQPAKWFGVLAFSLTADPMAQAAARLAALVIVGSFAVTVLAPIFSSVFTREPRDVCLFGIMPVVYYLFDYLTVIYTDLWTANNRIVAEFLPLFVAGVYMVFCALYVREYEQKAAAQRRETLVRMAVEQEKGRVESVRENEQKLRLIRHDLRLFLGNLAVCIENGTPERAREMIEAYGAVVDSTRLERYCGNETVNCVLSHYAARCRSEGIAFDWSAALDALHVDEILFSSIISNALDNAVMAQAALPPDKRRISLMLKYDDGKLLLCVKNPVEKPPVFADGLPVSDRKGHGYGCQSIRYLTRSLGGTCNFSVQDGQFVLRVVLFA